MKLDGAQLAEQNALRKQLYQEQELLQRFQESQEEKLVVQHEREKAALDVKVEDSKKELEKMVREICSILGQLCVLIIAEEAVTSQQ